MILKKDDKSKTRILTNALRLIFKHSLSLLLGQGIFIGISMIIMTPFINFVFDKALTASGFSYITIKNLGRFILNPVTIIVLILLFISIGLFFLFEISYLITFYSIIESGNIPKLLNVYLISLKRMFLIFMHRNFILLPIAWFVVALSNIPLIFFVIKKEIMFGYINEFIDKNLIIRIVIIALPIMLLSVMLQRLFVFQYCIIEGKKYKDACSSSKNIKKPRVIRAFFYIITWNIGIFLFIAIMYLVIMAFTALVIIGTTDKTLVIATFISINESMNSYLSIGIFSISEIANFALFTHLFYQYKKEQNEYFYFDNSVEKIFLKRKSYKDTIIIFSIILAVVNMYFIYNIIKNDSKLAYVDFDKIEITSHRGFSHDVPENTILAIEKAIEEQADYVEIDIRLTKDGELVLLHDESLKRTTGVRNSIWNLDYAQVSKLDAGKWLDDAYIGTKIPTLREVFELCKGTINLNLDLKYDNHIEGLEEKVVALIEEYEMENQCVITSTSLSTLENIKMLNLDIKTGYITYQIEKIYYHNENIDFFSINSYFVSDNLLQEVHEYGKKIHVWTVNTKKELNRVKRLGVDNIITDNPAYAKEILYQDESTLLLSSLLKLMITY